MQSIADGLPPEVAQQIHPDWWRNEQDYWANRDQLIAQYRNRWIAFANGAIVASGTSPVEVFHAAQQSGLHPYVTCVGREHEPCRMRRAVFSYDQAYQVDFGGDERILGRDVLNRVDVLFRGPSGEIIVNP